MASPIAVYGPRIEVAVTDAMWFEITRAAASRGQTRSEWIRETCRERLDREAEGRASA